MQDCNETTHTDRVDVTFEISLNEYGIVRNPKTNDTVFCLNPTDGFPPDDYEYQYSNYDISFSDVEEALTDAETGYFDFIGSDKKTEIKRLDNNSLSLTIYSLNQYNGCFSPHCY